jgi:hypothetical protein
MAPGTKPIREAAAEADVIKRRLSIIFIELIDYQISI